MTEDRIVEGGELSHGFKGPKTVKAVADTENKGYRPPTSQARPVSRPTPPKPPEGDAGGSK